jgi:hypothetical protein
MRWAAGGLLLTTLVPGSLAPTVALAATCPTLNVLAGSNFEIDTNANLKVDGGSPCIDWLAGGSGSAFRAGVLAQPDKPTGSGDNSFGQGTSENDPVPTVVSGSIPPNKSDLKFFGVLTETTASGKFLELFWSRVQNPSGTTNMDFELNQKFCDPTATPTNCTTNGVTAPRTIGDKLITYDLSKGGTVPSISIRTWTGSVWGAALVISGAGGTALGAVNTSAIAAADGGALGAQDPFTFGEVALSFDAIFPPGAACGVFGSAYLKSRSSDSFTSEIKDFIAPERAQITNCITGLTTNATPSAVLGSPISDTAHLAGAAAGATGTITFRLFFNDAICAAGSEVTTGLSPVTVNGPADYNSGNFTPTALGTYYWIASYSGDAANAGSTTACGDANESSTIIKLPSTIATAQTYRPQDTATITGTGTFNGKVSFQLFHNLDCSGSAVYSENDVALTGGTASTNNSTFVINAASAGSYSWRVAYNQDSTHLDVTSCVENSSVAITNGGTVTSP